MSSPQSVSAPLYECRVLLGRSDNARLELARCLLVNAGVRRDEIVETCLARAARARRSAHVARLSVFFPSSAKARRLAQKLRASRLRGVSISLLPLKDADWKTRWRRYFKPLAISPGVLVVPYHLRSAPRIRRRDRRPVFIDTSLAFGTGLHPTTQMVARLLWQRRGKLGRLLDVGTGSGILSVIASCYGAQEIWAIDSDRAAVKTARHNFFLNRCRPVYLKHVRFEDFSGGRGFDFIAANLLSEELTRISARLVSSLTAGGHLAVSGIYRGNYASVRRHFSGRGLRCRRVLRQKGWFAILFKKGQQDGVDRRTGNKTRS